MHVLIIGAGLAGPSLALALARQSIRSTIFERKPHSQDIGGVLMLASNAMRVLDKVVGIEDVIRPLGYSFTGLELYAGGYGPMEHLGGVNFDLGATSLTIRRPVLHEKLLELCEENEFVDVKFGKSLKGIEEDEKRVVALFEDGSRVEGDILIGVDGIHSRVRQHVVGGAEEAKKYTPQYTGHVVLGTSIDKLNFELEPGMKPPAFFLTPTGTILCFPTDPKAETYQWATFINVEERDKKGWESYKTSGDALKDLRKEWGSLTSPPVKSLIDHVTTENIVIWAPYEVPELPSWHTKRTCLLGDSCHAISPSAGQGTAQALDDVGLLARLLSSQQALDKGFEAIFTHYQKSRMSRMDEVKKFMKGSLATRAPTPSPTVFWLKKTGFKAMFMFQRWRGGLPRRSALTYDVTEEDIVVQ